MRSITPSQAKFLRGLAHSLKPVVFIGQKGITASLIESIREALDVHELIKVKFMDAPDKRQRADAAAEVEQNTDSRLAGMVGRIGIFYRPQPDPSKRHIILP